MSVHAALTVSTVDWNSHYAREGVCAFVREDRRIVLMACML